MDEIQGIQHNKIGIDQIKPKGTEDFKSMVQGFLKEVNGLQKEADSAINKFVSGKDVDIHDVMVAAQEANISFQLMLELRNRLLDAYREVMRMTV
ncbi:flagellar hook-basal body complex protein FliE [candidate division WOR-3 bacterium]|nr:flagellar hook-basal body complex protein FliE [candidate division WOR-3 bacterium]